MNRADGHTMWPTENAANDMCFHCTCCSTCCAVNFSYNRCLLFNDDTSRMRGRYDTSVMPSYNFMLSALEGYVVHKLISANNAISSPYVGFDSGVW